MKNVESIAVFKHMGLTVVKDSANSICKQMVHHSKFPEVKLIYIGPNQKLIARTYTKSEFKADVSYVLINRIGFKKEDLIHLCKLSGHKIPAELLEYKKARSKKIVIRKR